jgi:hypothetical protein
MFRHPWREIYIHSIDYPAILYNKQYVITPREQRGAPTFKTKYVIMFIRPAHVIKKVARKDRMVYNRTSSGFCCIKPSPLIGIRGGIEIYVQTVAALRTPSTWMRPDTAYITPTINEILARSSKSSGRIFASKTNGLALNVTHQTGQGPRPP